ncbi:hypothetical protein HCN44_009497 [Aphidius gifuensis]|uniref:THAP-type domain-containing protein n=1 Tax=Aphidius gifuensis TaxID=684658 RepID=A0A835CVH5_APHGI|nr:uncharacterized protein LOC122860259 [Aphidius gifuensis]KAF7998099.1 hypothetical protein HCN44_009497 [Aphidius gifuensis]
MENMCCIADCHNTESIDSNDNKNRNLRFYNFPNELEIKKRQLWLNAIRPHMRPCYKMTPKIKICSIHFLNNKKDDDPESPSYIPRLFSSHKKKVLKPKVVSVEKSGPIIKKLKLAHNVKMNDDTNNTNEDVTPIKTPTAPSSTAITPTTITKTAITPTSIIKTAITPTATTKTTTTTTQEVSKIPEVITKQKKNHEYFEELMKIFGNSSEESQTEPLINMKPELICFSCTLKCENGINTAETQAILETQQIETPIIKPQNIINKQNKIIVITKNIENEYCKIQKPLSKVPGFYGYQSLNNNGKFIEFCGVTKNVFMKILPMMPEINYINLNKEDKLMIFLMKLKLGLPFSTLSVLFNIEREYLKQLFITSIKSLRPQLCDYINWPHKAFVRTHLPIIFRDRYINARVIIDIIEVNIDDENNEANGLIEVDGSNQFKVLLGYTPDGYISFKSRIYAGIATDYRIIHNSGLLDQIEESDLVLTRKMYQNLQPFLEDINAGFSCPLQFAEKLLQKQNNNQYLVVKNVANRIDDILRKIKIFRTFKSMPNELFRFTDYIFTVIVGLHNLAFPSCEDYKND